MTQINLTTFLLTSAFKVDVNLYQYIQLNYLVIEAIQLCLKKIIFMIIFTIKKY